MSAEALIFATEPARGGRTTSVEWLCYVWCGVPGALLALAPSMGLLSVRAALTLFAVSFVGLNLAHMAATWVVVADSPGGWRAHAVERVYVPLGLALGAIAFDAWGAGIALLNIQIFFGVHHGLMQNYGLFRRAERRSGRVVGVLSARLGQLACVLPAMTALMWRMHRGSTFHGAPLFRIPGACVAIAGVGAALAVAAYVVREQAAFMESRGAMDLLGPATVLGTNLVWAALLLLVPHPELPIFAVGSLHYVQYLYFVWKTNAPKEVSSRALGRWRAPSFLPPRVGYLILLGALGTAGMLVLTAVGVGSRLLAVRFGWDVSSGGTLAPWVPALIAINLSHFWLDSRIWRSARPPPANARA